MEFDTLASASARTVNESADGELAFDGLETSLQDAADDGGADAASGRAKRRRRQWGAERPRPPLPMQETPAVR